MTVVLLPLKEARLPEVTLATATTVVFPRRTFSQKLPAVFVVALGANSQTGGDPRL